MYNEFVNVKKNEQKNTVNIFERWSNLYNIYLYIKLCIPWRYKLTEIDY